MVRVGIFTGNSESEMKGMNNRGQSVVEYIMLLAVVGTLIVTVMNSALIKDLLGDSSSFFGEMRRYLEITYQYGSYKKDDPSDNYSGIHDTYAKSASESRFWSAITKDQ
jgi:hypothetical protein